VNESDPLSQIESFANEKYLHKKTQ